MKKIITILAMSTLACALCAACDDAGKPDNPDKYVTEYYVVANHIESDIVIEPKDGESSITVSPGETVLIDESEFHYRPGMANSRYWKFVDACMKIDGEVVSKFIWDLQYWDGVRGDEVHDNRSSLTYTLPVTDELLETVANRCR
jgi:hypothetical protein